MTEQHDKRHTAIYTLRSTGVTDTILTKTAGLSLFCSSHLNTDEPRETERWERVFTGPIENILKTHPFAKG